MFAVGGFELRANRSYDSPRLGFLSFAPTSKAALPLATLGRILPAIAGVNRPIEARRITVRLLFIMTSPMSTRRATLEIQWLRHVPHGDWRSLVTADMATRACDGDRVRGHRLLRQALRSASHGLARPSLI